MKNTFFETICIKNRTPLLLAFHQKRMDKTRQECLNLHNAIPLDELIQLDEITDNSFWKCRITYSDVIHKIEYEKYEIKHPKTIKLIEQADFQYPYKYSDRSAFETILQNQKDADEIIICKKGLLTDSSYANLAFFDGRDWFTPKLYLLNGVKRKCLLQNKIIHETDISINNISFFQKIAFLNAMRGLSISYNFTFGPTQQLLHLF